MTSENDFFLVGLAAQKDGFITDALANYERVLLQQPQHAQALYLSGVIKVQLGDWVEGVQSMQSSLAINPNDPTAHFNLARALLDKQLFENAIAHFDQAIALRPHYAQAHLALGDALLLTGRHYSAQASFMQALQIQPDLLHAHLQLAKTQALLHQYEPAISRLSAITQQLPNHAESESLLAELKGKQQQHIQKIQTWMGYRQAHTAQGYRYLGVTFHQEGRHADAVILFDCSLARDPQNAETFHLKANSLVRQSLHLSAIECYDRATALDPQMADAWHNSGSALFELKHYEQAIVQFNQALQRSDTHADALFMKFYAQLEICDWTDWAKMQPAVIKVLNEGYCPIQPLPVLAMTDSGHIQKRAAENHFRELFGEIKVRHLAQRTKIHKGQRIRVGYFSPDFREHAVSFLTAELFELHDREKFEVFAFSFGELHQDDMNTRLRAGFEHFHDVHDLSDDAVVDLARNLDLDIAFDLAGYTVNSRNGLFAKRLAPIQINYLGYPGTMGHPQIDYIIGDPIVTPSEYRQHYSEKVIELPCFQVNDRKRSISELKFTKVELGIPDSHFLFCCFNANYKLTPLMFDTWLQILERVPDSSLLLIEEHHQAATNLLQLAKAKDIASSRLVFVPKIQPSENLARYRVADLFLDSLPFNAGTTASDALWAGLPVLTCAGEAFASRMAASLLHAVDLPELVTYSLSDYITKAVALAQSEEGTSKFKKHLSATRDSCILFDTPTFVARLEDELIQICEGM